ncbi:hypothetical protein NBRC116588_14610 [Pyruvatibacter sp. HU-CL02332]|uniref:hypothetical protein n=1 Tax=Pyruvatibacter sp. HU-CL02332 TaxID=3127650 RepID=UPI00310A23E4
MAFITDNIFWILLVSGVITSSMLAAAVAPRLVFRQFFGTILDGPLGNAIMRNWGLVIGMSGLLLIYAAYDETVRTPIMLFSIVGKLFFSVQVFAAGSTLKAARGGAIIDLVIGLVFCAYLIGN